MAFTDVKCKIALLTYVYLNSANNVFEITWMIIFGWNVSAAQRWLEIANEQKSYSQNSVRGLSNNGGKKCVAEKYSDGEQLWLDIGIIDYDRDECV